MACGFWQIVLLVAACTVELSNAKLQNYDFSDHSESDPLIAGFNAEFICKVNDSQTALLTIGGKIIAEAKGEALKEVMMTHTHNGELASCIAKDSSGQMVNVRNANLSVWFPPMLPGHIRHHYKLALGHKDHVSIHFLTNPPIHKHHGQVRVLGPQGNFLHHFKIIHTIHNPDQTTEHYFILPFHEVKLKDFGNYTLTITSVHEPNQPMVLHFTISDLFASDSAHTSLDGGVVTAIVIGVLLTVGILVIMIFLMHRAWKRQPLHEDRRPIVIEEAGPSVEDGLVDDVFTDSRPGRSHIGSIEDSRM